MSERTTATANEPPGRRLIPVVSRESQRAAAARAAERIRRELEEKRRVIGHAPPYSAIDERRWDRHREERGHGR
jgi:hypothetical protein